MPPKRARAAAAPAPAPAAAAPAVTLAGGTHQKLRVAAAVSVKAFVEENKLDFARGNGFYQLTKKEDISAGKLVRGQRSRAREGEREGGRKGGRDSEGAEGGTCACKGKGAGH